MILEILNRIEIYKFVLIGTTLYALIPKHGKWINKYFIIFLLMAFFCELFFTHYAKLYLWPSNYPAFNIYTILVCGGYMYFYLTYFKTKTLFKPILFICSFWLLGAIFWFFYSFDPMVVNITSYQIGLVISCGLALYYLYKLIFILPYSNIFKQPLFYLSIGLLLFYSSAFPMLNFIHTLIANKNATSAFKDILQLGNIILVLGYLGTAICMKKEI